MLKKCAEIWDEVRNQSPLVHCITNYVTITDVANIILAGGASPAMVENTGEAYDFALIASALYFNLGTLIGEQEAAMIDAAQAAAKAGRPLVIDPVACGVIPSRAEVLNRIARAGKITCIKGNRAEIKSLAGMKSQARGVDSLDEGEGLEEACRFLAEKQQLVVAATGAIDVVADYEKLALIHNGSTLFECITGAGCMVGRVAAACIGAVPSEPWLATISSIAAFNIAGEKAARISGENPGTFHSLLFDELHRLRGADIVNEARVEWKD
ncbi:MAG: hydroxyethylthiazole kinase [Syntrophomonas sp.]